MHDKRSKFVSNNDGDSVIMTLDQDFWDTKTIKIRLANVWAPEKKDPGGPEVKTYVNNWFAIYGVTEWGFIVLTHKTRTDQEKMSLNRYVADITTIDGKHHLNSDVMKYIVDNGFTGGIGSISRAIDDSARDG